MAFWESQITRKQLMDFILEEVDTEGLLHQFELSSKNADQGLGEGELPDCVRFYLADKCVGMVEYSKSPPEVVSYDDSFQGYAGKILKVYHEQAPRLMTLADENEQVVDLPYDGGVS